MATATPISALLLFFLLISGSAATATGKRRVVFYCNEVLYDGQHSNRTILPEENWLVAFDEPINLDNNVLSTQVHRAQSFSFYGKRERFTAWLGFSFVFNYNNHTGGGFNFRGADPLTGKGRDISVIGGTGDIFIARGIATLMIDD